MIRLVEKLDITFELAPYGREPERNHASARKFGIRVRLNCLNIPALSSTQSPERQRLILGSLASYHNISPARDIDVHCGVALIAHWRDDIAAPQQMPPAPHHSA